MPWTKWNGERNSTPFLPQPIAWERTELGIPYLSAIACFDKPATVYVLIDTRDQSPFYIGVTTRSLRKRMASHIHDSLRLNMVGERYRTIREIDAAGRRPEIVGLETVMFVEWADAEEFWIGCFRAYGAILTNRGTGGPGAKGSMQSGMTRQRRKLAATGRDVSHLHTPEMRAKAGIKISRTLTGRTPTIETREAMSNAKRGEKNNFYGKRHSLAVVEKIKAALRGRPGPTGKSARHRRPVVIDGIHYWGRKGAAEALKVRVETIDRWIREGKGSYTDAHQKG